jgi:phenylpropionate dioxygenase-like ring-hydroxylating dioxygenase large terminal subunit
MLSVDQTEMLTRVGPGTPMGDLLRRFWTPILLHEELPEPDCPPVRVRIFGEDLVAFRDTAGRLGLIEELCAHRQTSLFFGRNEEGGLRCPYHGWKYDVAGNCIDMPTESPESNFKDKVKLLSYGIRDGGGIIWAYLGPKDLMPPELPGFRFQDVPEDHRLHTKYLRECNFAQAIDGGIDSVHTNFLHAGLDRYRKTPEYQTRIKGSTDLDLLYRTSDSAPKFMCKQMEYGLLVGSRRNIETEDKYYWRFNHFLMPFYSMTPRGGGGHAFVPIDDHHCWSFNLTSRVDRPYTEEERARALDGIAQDHDQAGGVHMHGGLIPGTYKTIRNRANDFLIDREMQKNLNFTGLPGTGIQDSMAQVTMGPIANRTKEHLGVTDIAIIQSRRMMLAAAIALREGTEPSEPLAPEFYSIVGVQFVEDKDVTFEECIERQRPHLYATLPQ